MAFGGSGGFTFGSNNNQQSAGFGGFGGGSNTNTNTSGFGATSNPGFGSSTVQSNPFGGGGSGFGASTTNAGGFGSNSNTGSSLFGNKPTTSTNLFGSGSSNTGAGGLFGNTTNTNTGSGFGNTTGGFGSTTNNAFGSSSGGGGTAAAGGFGGFGSQNKPAFGQNPSTTPLFGQGGAGTTGGFGSTNAFGSGGSGTALSNQPVPPSEGTATVPFNPTNEKDNQQNISYMNVSFQQPYQKYSVEELRLGDYNAGRRFGNGGGGAGAFGASNFGGFGATSTGGGFGSSPANNPFGSNTSSSGGFGNNTSTAFGASANAGGGLFGNKSAAGGLFGNQSSGTSSGSLFGTSNNATTTPSNPFGGGSAGFGSGANTSGGLFGNNSQTQAKPSLFGNTGASNTSTGFSFGNNTQSNAGGGLFGNNSQQQQPAGGLFGNANNQQQQKSSLFGNSTGGGFGPTSTQGQSSGGLFGTSNNATAGGGLFGNSQASTNTGGGLFGNTASNTGGGLFGNQNNNASKPGGLFTGSTFGNNQQQSTGGGLFGTNNQQPQQQSGGLFGSSANQPSNAFGFSNNTQNKPAGSMFGNNSTNQSGGLFGNSNSNSLFGGSMNQQQQSLQQQDGIKHASLLDPNPYGQSSIWTGLPTPNMENSKPLVTPLVATQKLKESQAKPPPSLRLNQSRYMTPPRRTGTYGFTYSTYGTPNSAASTPGGNGLSNSMYVSRFSGGSFGRSMGKAASVSNLRSQYTDGESVLTPGAFAPSASRYSSGSIRRLHIDRSIKSDLFSRPPQPALPAPSVSANRLSSSEPAPASAGLDPAPDTAQKLKKRVSFDRETTGGRNNGELSAETGALVRTEGEDDEVSSRDRSQTNGAISPADQPRGNELAVVPEDRESDPPVARKQSAKVTPLEDPKPGDYWMKPTRAEMSKMSRDQLKRFVGFEVGRHGAGKVKFDEAVDLTNVPLDDLFSSIVEIHARSVTVYPDASTKPPQGKGLNVPSTISIENSWPRAKGKPTALTSGPLFDKHIRRLQNIQGTNFKDYDSETGVWTFTVPHYTRYGLDYDDDEMEDFGESQLSTPPDSIHQYKTADMSVMEVDSDNDSSRQDDTFLFKQKTVPGGFDRQAIIDDEPEDALVKSIEHNADGSEHSAISEEELSDADMDMAGSYPAPGGPVLKFESPSKPILRPGGFGTPGKPLLDLDGDWAEQLQRTISPRKQDRDALREAQNKILLDRAYEPIKPKSAIQKKDFRTSLDVMNAIFDRPERRTRAGKKGQVQAEQDFEFPYAKRAKTFDPNDDDMSDADKAWHSSFKPNFTSTNQLVCKTNLTPVEGEWEREMLVRDDDSVIVVEWMKPQSPLDITSLLQYAEVKAEKGTGIPKIEYSTNMPFSVIGSSLPPHLANSSAEPQQLYQLLHVLYDTYEDEFSYGLTEQQKEDYAGRILTDRLSHFLTDLLANQDADKLAAAEKDNPLEASVRYLARHDVKSAADILMKTKNFHVALLVSQIASADDMFQEDIRKQIAAWRDQNTLSEMTEDMRALYGLLSGNTTVNQGKPGVAEDKAETFSLSQKYSFGWLQAFAMSCWYGKVKEGTIGQWVEDFQKKVDLKEETADPGMDPLWMIFKLYAAGTKGSKVQRDTFPQALSALETKWDVSAAFHVFNSIRAALAKEADIDKDAADRLAATFASRLESRADVVGAVYALLHLQSPTRRAAAIQDLLDRRANVLPELEDDGTAIPSSAPHDIRMLHLLKNALHVPTPWLAQAKALHARSVHDTDGELRYLVQAEDWDGAHTCLCKRVAPRLVIDEEIEVLQQTVRMLDSRTERVGKGEMGIAWDEGAGVYSVLCDLLLAKKVGNADWREYRKGLLEGVRKGMEKMSGRLGSRGRALGEGMEMEELEERVALKEMGRMVKQVVEVDGSLELRGVARGKVLGELPLTGDERVDVGRGLGVEYYKRVMGGGK